MFPPMETHGCLTTSVNQIQSILFQRTALQIPFLYLFTTQYFTKVHIVSNRPWRCSSASSFSPHPTTLSLWLASSSTLIYANHAFDLGTFKPCTYTYTDPIRPIHLQPICLVYLAALRCVLQMLRALACFAIHLRTLPIMQ